MVSLLRVTANLTILSGRESDLIIKIDGPMWYNILALKDLVVEPIYRELHPELYTKQNRRSHGILTFDLKIESILNEFLRIIQKCTCAMANFNIAWINLLLS